MRVRGNQPPEGAYRIFPQPDKDGFVCIRFFENTQEVDVGVDGGDPVVFYEYDEYELIVPDEPDLAANIEAHYEEWLLTAKSYSPEAMAAAEAAAAIADLS